MLRHAEQYLAGYVQRCKLFARALVGVKPVASLALQHDTFSYAYTSFDELHEPTCPACTILDMT
eukprot:5160228-Pleurochrysis_carterae.AAC.1